MTYPFTKYQAIEGIIHLLFWLFIFTAVNVNWQHNWFDVASRPNSPAPLSVVCFPIFFYLHAFWAIPNYLVHKKWLPYGLSLILIFAVPELIRIVLYTVLFNRTWELELMSRDSLIFGPLGVAWLAFISSMLYRLLSDRLSSNKALNEKTSLSQEKTSQRSALPPADVEALKSILIDAMTDEKLYLQKELNLASLAEHLQVPEKKLSGFINQYLKTGFTDFINEYRINHFIQEAEDGKLQNLSISGLAHQCGFSSKATFYRAFKKVKGCTPSVYFDS